MNFLYPYHQTIGFLLDCAGLNEQADAWMAVLPPTNRFFVDHEAKATWPYNAKWQVRYPSWLK